MPRRSTPSGSTRRRTVAGPATARVTGVLSQGRELTKCDEHATIPADRIEQGEIVLRIADDLPKLGLAAGDLLIAQLRTNGRAATGELVIATLHEHVFIGRWWGKHGSRALLGNELHPIVQAPELAVFGAVTLVARDENV